ncbi:microfibril-associated glycoprotein 4-like [Mya arenaria]|uniref:microfibril-associated glycoprotein 4-like n=1 Tax=Mya arenaria TaxID=6604 RepID=UPI0022E11792|nr:microfibril-associated glycoprotein 4-like [Mya arenaria]
MLCSHGELVLPDSTSCSPCPGGYYSPEGSSICTQCSSGTFCPVGSSNETVCVAGYYSHAGAASCTICPAGYYCPNASTTFHCPTGTSSKEGSSICLEANSCYDILNKTGTHRSGVYNITTLRSQTTISVYCDMDTEGGGWTVFQRRFDGSVDFYRNFSEYENGFGSASGEYWLGLRTIQEMLSKASHELRIDVESFSGRSGYDVYSNFRLQGPGYTFFVDNRTRSLNMTTQYLLLTGCSYTPYGQNFTTFDRDQDQRNDGNCAVLAKGAWWYNYCESANLNGVYGRVVQGDGIGYFSFNPYDNLRLTKVMFRPSG